MYGHTYDNKLNYGFTKKINTLKVYKNKNLF